MLHAFKMNGEAVKLFSLNSLTSMAYSLIMPVMALFLIGHLNAEPAYIGLYTVSTTLSGMLFSQLAGKMLDRGVSGKRLFIATMLASLTAAICFANIHQFWQSMLVGPMLMGVAGAGVPVLLAMIRNYAQASGKNSLKLNSQMRSGVSLVWIVDPPIAFAAVDWMGFSANFYLSASLSAVVIVMAVAWLPSPTSQAVNRTTETEAAPSYGMDLWLLGAVMMLGNLANMLYLTAMPLYLSRELALPVSLPGTLMGLTAALEIPVMLMVPRWAARYGSMRMLLVGFIAALLFYLSLQFISSVPGLIAIQLFNGIFFGIFAGLGVSVIQDAAAERPGFASAFYTNAMRLGTMLGTSLAGILAQLFSYKGALFASVIVMFANLLLLGLVALRNNARPQS